MTDLSVVLPCFRAADIARASVDQVRRELDAAGVGWEVVVVDDGGGDFAPDEWHGDPHVRLVRLPVNQGKGAAVRAGMLAARGHVRIFTDVDLPFGTDRFAVIAAYLRDLAFHVVIGDRTLPGSDYRQRLGVPRRLASAVFTGFVGTIVTGGFFDTQCGLKAVRGDVAEVLFPLLRIDRFAFDVELVYVALKHRLDIKRIPVRLINNDTSSVRLLRDSLRGAVDVFRIRYHQLRGWYASPALDRIVRADFEAAGSMHLREMAPP
jgi:glycosyltransferase involved in cell wall biosynthesis